MINLTQILKDENGKDHSDKTRNQAGVVIEDNGVLTLSKVCCRAALSEFQNEPLSMDDKDRNYRLWQKLNNQKEIKLKAEEIVVLKKQISKGFTTLVYGQTADMLEKVDPLKIVKKD